MAADRFPPPDKADMARPDCADKLDNREQLVHYIEQ
jgi:hypothetical protein